MTTTSAPTVRAMLAATAAEHGGRTAVVTADGARRSWAEVEAEVERRAGGLRARDVGPGDAVGIVLGVDPDFVTTFLATLAVGAVAVPLNPALRADELGAHLRSAGAVGVVAVGAGAARVRGATGDARTAPWVTDVATLDADGRTRLAAAASSTAAADGGARAAPALHAFSSGSTGTPKGIVRTHANLVAEADQFTATCSVDADDVVLTSIALFHAHGLGNCLLAAVRSGASMVFADPLQRGRLLEGVRTEGVTVWPTVPPVVRALAGTTSSTGGGGWRVRLCFTAGAALPRESFDAFAARFGVPVRQLYGCSEAGSVTVNLDPDPVATAGSVGRPMGGVRLVVRGPDGTPAPTGTTGEVSFASPALTAGYVGVDSGSFRDGWFTTGDLGHLDDAGRLTITGRTTLFISTGGYKVDPVEVEDVLRRHPAVADVVVVGAPGPLGSELVKAVVVVAGSHDEAALRRELVALCGEHLAVHKVPRVVEFLPELPRSPLGKLLRKDLLALSEGSPRG